MPRKKREVEKPSIIIDSREQRPLVFSDIFLTEAAALPAGDYSLKGFTDKVAIERKRLGELCGCCGGDRERFMNQIERVAQYTHSHLVIEGDMSDIFIENYRAMVHPNSVLGTLMNIQERGIGVWFCSTPEHTAHMVERIMLRVIKKES